MRKIITNKNIFAPFKEMGFKFLILSSLVSGAGNALIPISFAIEAIKVEPSGWGITIVLLLLWGGRFIGMILYKKFGYKIDSIMSMVWSDIIRILAQLFLLIWIIILHDNIIVMAISAMFYGFATAFFLPSQFISISLIIPKKLTKQANSWLSIMGDIYLVAGPAIGSIIVITIGFKSVLALDIITFLISLIFLMKLVKCKRITNTEDNEKTNDSKIDDNKAEKLPVWVNLGLISWFFCSLSIGFMGVAGPTLIIGMHSASIWAVMATFMATGSLLGSFTSLLNFFGKTKWISLHLLCGLGLGLQLFVLTLNAPVVILYLFGFMAGFFNVLSCIKWDTTALNKFSGKTLHNFASLDYFVYTSGVPIGMLIFGLANTLHTTLIAVLAISILTFIFTIPVFLTKNKD